MLESLSAFLAAFLATVMAMATAIALVVFRTGPVQPESDAGFIYSQSSLTGPCVIPVSFGSSSGIAVRASEVQPGGIGIYIRSSAPLPALPPTLPQEHRQPSHQHQAPG